MNKSYYEIRDTAKLIDYSLKAAAGAAIYVETYKDDKHEYLAYFSETSTNHLPLTIIKHDPV